MIISNISVPLVGIVDTAVMGHLDAPFYLGAVGVGAMIFNVLFMGLNFLRMGTTGVTAQAFGAGYLEQVRATLLQALLLAWVLAATLLLTQGGLAQVALWVVAPSDPLVGQHALLYFDVRIWASPLVLSNYVLLGWFIAVQRARAALILMLAINLTNVALDLLFVVGLGMLVDGVALASVLAELTGVVTGVLLASRHLKRIGGEWQRQQIFNTASIRRLLNLNGNIFVRSLALMFSFAFLTTMSARMGPLILAANTVLLQFQNLSAYLLDGFAHAAEAMVGRAVGEADRDGLQRAVKLCLWWSLGVALPGCAIFYFAGNAIIALLTDLPAVRETAGEYLIWLVISPLVSVWSFLYDGVYIGATRAREMRNTMVFSSLAFITAWWALRGFGNHGLWMAFTCFMAARGLSQHLVYRYLERRAGFFPA